MTWPTNDRVPARKDGNVSSSQIAILTGLQNQSVIGNLSNLKQYGKPNIKKLGFTWQRDRYDQLYLTPTQAVSYVREVLLPLISRRGSQGWMVKNFLKGYSAENRDDKIIEAMRNYTGPRTKQEGWPWLRNLREQSGISDITAADRERLWPKIKPV